uniref:Ferredoxin--nitrite reductase, chloroplastic n=1 Tax=Heterosigma akashiwo TaxID=2829 RepID=A0A6S9KFP9_HETAK|mmetsp:Transcript_25122/g.34776  ORF Transcript_25122/g.34776 Transcript_25122/m.34776 type:complete len:580 (-) Transcript_25122:36-1775(-)|eukprot:CAMPEP_0194574868 /NCGR_PEP_ID=MMETSP0292-20121207/10560_1 /TAXON_ID=39354 /ORGANISM="Heterosigma akashiwo, Strain CCMP2393" /LENGTH=579 /DNA_ID=CAMNT_0039426501 /DNA_START=69 /DNA_END=1808 /DNA_ORIENTATION=-
MIRLLMHSLAIFLVLSSAAAFLQKGTLMHRKSPAVLRMSASTASKEVIPGSLYIPEDKAEAAASASNFEKVKLEKCGSNMWTDVHEYAAAIRSGQYSWEDINGDDIDIRLKWAGLFHRRKRTPGKFMMRLKVPNGILTSEQLRLFADTVEPYGEIGVIDITTRQNIQMRGIVLEDASDIINNLNNIGLTSLMSGMDNVRNMVGSPIAGIDPHEMIDTRQLCIDMQKMITNDNKGRPEYTNLPRKMNFAISGSRDDYAHTSINDVGFQPIANAEGKMGFNVVVGGYFSIKAAVESIPLNMWVPPEAVVPLSEAFIRYFRDNGQRVKDRQKTRMMILIEQMGVEAFRAGVVAELAKLDPAVETFEAVPEPEDVWEKRDLMGIHAQKQEGLSWVGVVVPAGRLFPEDVRMAADVADKYCAGEVRMTVEQNFIFPNVKNEDLEEMQTMPFFQKFPVEAGNLSRGLVTCTGAQFCSFGLVETKNQAVEIANALEAKLDIPNLVRIHWTGCPNSCGQAQVGDIGLMGAPAKKDGKAVPGVNMFLGGKVGERPELAEMAQKSIPAEDLVEELSKVLVEKFGATEKK